MPTRACLWLLLPVCCSGGIVGQAPTANVPKALIVQLQKTRDKARQELDDLPDQRSPEIDRALLGHSVAIGILRIDDVHQTQDGAFALRLKLERTLHGTLPDSLTIQSFWHDGMWIKRPPVGWNRIKPEVGKRVVSGFYFEQGQPRTLGTLDLSNPDEAKWLPAVEQFLEYEKRASDGDLSGYFDALDHEAWFVRYLVIERLSQSQSCQTDPACEKLILASIRRELDSSNPNERMNAVNHLRVLVDAHSHSLHSPPAPHFNMSPVRELLAQAEDDKNVLVGDQAFYVRATLDFYKKENIGYCARIIPAMRRVNRYPADGPQPGVGGALDGGELCLLH